MDKKSVTETAADAAKIAVGIAAMAVDALMGADRTTEGNRSGTGATGQNGTGNAPETSTSPSEPTGSDARNSFGAVDINRAEFDELVSLKHIGRSRAKRIMSNRPFRSLEDLASQGIVPADTLAQLRDRLTV